MSSLNNSSKYASLGTLSELTRPQGKTGSTTAVPSGLSPSSLPQSSSSSCSPPTTTTSEHHHPLMPHQQHHQHHHQNHHLSPSSLSTEECSSSRFSSLQEDTESLKSAILDSFRMHWTQAWSIMETKVLSDITMDDLSSILNHIEQMISLLVEESTADIRTVNSSSYCESNKSSYDSAGQQHQQQQQQFDSTISLSPLLDFLFSQAILDKVFRWSEMSGEWKYAMYLEQLKLYELLISQLCQQADMILFQQPFLQPLIQLLNALSNPSNANFSMISFIEIEKRLVLLLNTLCVAITQNPKLLEVLLVYSSSEASNRSNGYRSRPVNSSAILSNKKTSSPLSSITSSSSGADRDLLLCDSRSFSFPVFLLLIQFVHREGAIGQQSRDALLLCLALSREDERLAYYIVNQTDFCPLLATGLSGLFSSLPRVVIGQSMSADAFQFKDDLLHSSKEIEQFLKCLDFCNAVAQISHPIIQVQLLNFIYNGFLVSVIGPALHQNTLDEIITTTAYLDLFIRSISEPNLIRIFLEFLCFEQYDNRCIINSLISRISAKSKLSLITLILFKTLLDINCEDLQFELIFKYLLRGQHLLEEAENAENTTPQKAKKSKVASLKEAINCYQQNWLAISGQKLFSNSLSHYLHNLCPHQSAIGRHSVDTDSMTDDGSLDDLPFTCKCHSAYYLSYLEYLHDARYAIDHCRTSVRQWKNAYTEPCFKLTDVADQIIFCTVDEVEEGNLNNNDTKSQDGFGDSHSVNRVNEFVIEAAVNGKPTNEKPLPFNGQSNGKGMLMKNGHADDDVDHRLLKHIDPFEATSNGNADAVVDVAASMINNDGHFSSPVIGLFLNTLLTRMAQFFENDVLTNLHLTSLLTTLSQSPHKLLLSLFFDETLARHRGVPCLLHLLQKLSLDAQSFVDDIHNFEATFQSAKSNLQSMPIGELNCQLLTGNHHHHLHQNKTRSYSVMQTPRAMNIEASLNKGIGALKSFFRSSSISKPSLSRRNSNASISSITSHVLEVIPGAVKFSITQPKMKELPPGDGSMDRMNELVYNLIIFDEFLLEMSAILIEQSIGNYVE